MLERVGRIGNGWLPFTIDPAEIADAVDHVRSVARDAGRDPDEIEVTAWPGSHDVSSEWDVDYIRRYVAAGASRVLFWPSVSDLDDLPAMGVQLERYREDVLDKV